MTIKSNRYLIDTNILIYATVSSSTLHTGAKKFLDESLSNNIEMFISTQNVLEYKKVISHTNKLATFESCEHNLKILFKAISLIYEDSATRIEFRKLEKKYKPKGNLIFDLWLASTAIANGIDIIATNNVKDFGYIKEIKSVNPF